MRSNLSPRRVLGDWVSMTRGRQRVRHAPLLVGAEPHLNGEDQMLSCRRAYRVGWPPRLGSVSTGRHDWRSVRTRVLRWHWWSRRKSTRRRFTGFSRGPGRRALAIATVAAAALCGQFALPTSASAYGQPQYPAGCFSWYNNNTYDYPPWWSRNSCFIGPGYIVDDNSVRLPQWMVYWSTGGACNAGIIDGVVGTATWSAFRCYQARRSLIQDGIIGTNSWSKLSNDTVLDFCIGSPLICYYGVGRSGRDAIGIKVGDAYHTQENDLGCSFSLVYSIDPILSTGSTGRTANQCVGA